MKPTVLMPIAMIALMLLAAPAGATMQYFTNQSEWIAATSGVFTIDFSGVVVPDVPGYVDYSIGGLQLHNVDFRANPEALEGVQVCSLGCEQRNSFSGNYLRGNTFGSKFFQATLPADVYALSMLVLTDPRGSTVTFSFSSSETKVMTTYTDTVPDFFGVISDQAIQWVRMESDGTNTVLLDNFAYGEAAVPEANSIWLAGAGILTLWAARRLRRLRLQPVRRG
ncbi:MAG TPA: hypothetical protein VLH09_11785 [Bryobacteraceae bacterium]|nr:hypothetical protein [Bryobacteraceae bacterium]